MDPQGPLFKRRQKRKIVVEGQVFSVLVVFVGAPVMYMNHNSKSVLPLPKEKVKIPIYIKTHKRVKKCRIEPS